MEKNSRIFQIDNIKFLLMFVVVFGHLTEQMSFKNSGFIYLLIYSFHMPAFAFISGYCCKKVTGIKLLGKYLYPYLIFQTCYITFTKYILQSEITFQYTTPYWLLWYLLALFLWNIMLSIFSDNIKTLMWGLIGTSILAMVVGYENTISYYLCLSRTIVMFPFFIGGYYINKTGLKILTFDGWKTSFVYKVLSILSVIMVLIVLYLNKNRLQSSWAYHSYPYQALDYNIAIRFFFFLTSIVFINFLCVFTPHKKLKIITNIGKNTMEIFLLHGFIIRYLSYNNILQTMKYPEISILLVTSSILLLCSSTPVKFIMKPFIVFPYKQKYNSDSITKQKSISNFDFI